MENKNIKTDKSKTTSKENLTKLKQKQALKQTKQFKDKYFDFYDDIKSNTHDVYDW